MNIAIVGIGGIGGYVGAYLAHTYGTTNQHSITFIQRGIHGKTITEHGLTFIAKQTFTVHPHKVLANPEKGDIFDIIFFCVKSKDLESSVLSLKEYMHSQTVCISLLNGVCNAQRIQQLLPQQRVLDGCIYVSASITAPGQVTQKGGAGTIYIGDVSGVTQDIDYTILEILTRASLKAQISNDILTEVWKKYLFICPFATMTSLYNMPIGILIRKPALCDQTKQLMHEIVSLSHVYKAQLTQTDIDAAIELAFKIPEHTPTSMQLDVYSGKIPEIDVFTQFVVEHAAKTGIDVPVYKELLPQLQKIISEQIHNG